MDDTLSIMPNVETAESFLSSLNESHLSVSFMMELGERGKLPFLGTEIRKCNGLLETRVYRKPTDTGLLLHYKSHVDVRYKKSLLKTMLDRVFKVSPTWQLFHLECDRLTQTFSRLQYPAQLLQSTISNFVTKKVSGEPISTRACKVNEAPVRILLPFKDQRSANSARRQLGELGRKIGIDIRPVYASRKIGHEIKPKEKKPPIINQQRVVYHYKCSLCDANYVGYTCRHLYQCVEEHKGSSSIGNPIKEQHGTVPSDIYRDFKILRKCQSKFDCLIYEMLSIKELKVIPLKLFYYQTFFETWPG